jgi:hypothetical protein
VEGRPPSFLKGVILPFLLLFVGIGLLTDPKGLWQLVQVLFCWALVITFTLTLVYCLIKATCLKIRSFFP